MAIGEGEYDELATMVLDISRAVGVCVVVVGGVRGSGFAQQVKASNEHDAAKRILAMAESLREVAAKMETDANLIGAKAKA